MDASSSARQGSNIQSLFLELKLVVNTQEILFEEMNEWICHPLPVTVILHALAWNIENSVLFLETV